MSQNKVAPADLSKAIERTLAEYAGVVFADLEESTAETARECSDEIRANALGHGWKDYAKTWTKTKEKSRKSTSSNWIVHAKNGGYQIAHLLEKGHAKRGGGRSRAFPHIAPAEAHAEERLITQLRQKIGG